MEHSSTVTAGHRAQKPGDIPVRGLKQVLLRVNRQIQHDHIKVASAGVAFYFFLAVFPALAATVSIYGLAFDPQGVEQQVSAIAEGLPEQASNMIGEILKSIVEKSDENLGWSMLLGLALTLYSAKQGISALFEGVNMAYDEIDERGFFKKNGLELLFTLGAIIFGLLLLALVVGFPAVIESLNLPVVVDAGLRLIRWVLLAAMLSAALAMIYKMAPHRSNPKFKWVSWGAVIATILWLIGSAAFSVYVENFGSYDKTYGSFAAVIILMLWFFLTAFSILLGAEINAELEHQTSADTTTGSDQPMGQRGAFHADHVAGDGSERPE